MTQNNLGNALLRLGERESGTMKLEEAVVTFREALKEWTREGAERAPRAGSLANHQRRKRDAADYTAAQAVAAPLLAKRNGQYRHAERTKAAIAEQRKFSALLKMLRAGLA